MELSKDTFIDYTNLGTQIYMDDYINNKLKNGYVFKDKNSRYVLNGVKEGVQNRIKEFIHIAMANFESEVETEIKKGGVE